MPAGVEEAALWFAIRCLFPAKNMHAEDALYVAVGEVKEGGEGGEAVCTWEAEIASWAMKHLLYDQETEMKTTDSGWLGARLEGRSLGIKLPRGNAGVVGDIKQLNIIGSYRVGRWEVTPGWISSGELRTSR